MFEDSNSSSLHTANGLCNESEGEYRITISFRILLEFNNWRIPSKVLVAHLSSIHALYRKFANWLSLCTFFSFFAHVYEIMLPVIHISLHNTAI